MPTIDSDAHVLETAETWKFLDERERRFTPMIVQKTFGDEQRNSEGKLKNEYWVVNGRIHEKDNNVGSNTPEESREMRSVEARIRHMDELEVDIQVLYPTLMLRPVANNAALEYALCRSYNRWLAEIWKQAGGRLRWVAAPPILSMDKIREEMIWAKAHGACGIFMRCLENEKALSDAYFHPLYEIAGELDLAICIHLGNGSYTVHDFYTPDSTFTKFKLPTIGAFHSLILSGTPEKFPKVRWGVIEVSADWLPFILRDLRKRFRKRGRRMPDDILGANKIYVTCEVSDDLPYVLAAAGGDNIVIGTDYGHTDASAEIEALRMLRQNHGIDSKTVDKILWDNPRALYGLN